MDESSLFNQLDSKFKENIHNTDSITLAQKAFFILFFLLVIIPGVITGFWAIFVALSLLVAYLSTFGALSYIAKNYSKKEIKTDE